MNRAPTSLDFSDPLAVRRWLDHMQESTDDVLAIAHDQTRPLGERDLGRARAIRILTEAAKSVTNLLVFARRGLPPAVHVDTNSASTGRPRKTG